MPNWRPRVERSDRPEDYLGQARRNTRIVMTVLVSIYAVVVVYLAVFHPATKLF